MRSSPGQTIPFPNWYSDADKVFGSNLSAYAMLVRLYLAKCADKDGKACPSLNTIAKNCNISRPTVIKAIQELEAKGWISKELRQFEEGNFASSMYQLLVPLPTDKKKRNPVTQDRTIQSVDSALEHVGYAKELLEQAKKELQMQETIGESAYVIHGNCGR